MNSQDQEYLDKLTVKTTASETFTGQESRRLARLIYRRFGNDRAVALLAWRRLLENNCSQSAFERLLGLNEMF